MVPCAWWFIPRVSFVVKFFDQSDNLWSCHHPPSERAWIVSETHSTSVSFDGSIVLLVGLIYRNGGELPARLLDGEIASLKFPGYFGLGCGQ